MTEIWKDIKGYEGLYQVSNHGNVKSIDRIVCYRSGREALHRGRLLIQHQRTGGYMYVVLSRGNMQKAYRVHRLVADAFVENPDNKPMVNHLDENNKNNMACNLEWCTHAENINYGTRTERAAYTRKMNSRPFICIETGETFRTQAECRRIMEKKLIHLSDVLNGRREKCEGLHFEFIGEDK